MGNAHGKEVADDNTGMTQSECRLLHDTWHGFCSANHEGGVLIFSAFLTQNPSLLTLFRRFRVMPLAMLPSDPAFRAHACTVAYQVTSMVDNAGDPVLVEALIRKNAVLHTTKAGVYPHHFDILGRVLMEVMVRRDDKKQITPAAFTAWRKLLEFMLRITNDVYTEAGIQFVKPGLKPSSLSDTTSEDSMSAFETCLSGMSNTSEPHPGLVQHEHLLRQSVEQEAING
ncbi:hypothetical protein V5799_033709 [Amblyomma americanum]|uniref:Globin domain-containing protein n=1 Tax=Amblyomma americanum TaxID=6943 RepID=A0AAQ4DMI6_AMBAM